MAIKYSTGENLGLPQELISLSGSWSSAPESGGIITFSGNAVFVGGAPSNGGTIDIPGVGSFVVTGTSSDRYLGYTKTTVSLTDLLGEKLSNFTPSSRSNAFISCVDRESGSSASEIVNQIKSLLGLSFSLPRIGINKLYEPVWSKDGQSIKSLLNEILTNCGCILYCKDNNIYCKTIGDFFSGLSGSSNNNTIASNFAVDGKQSSNIGNVTISGTKQIREKLPTSYTNGNTSIVRSDRNITTTTESPDGKQKTVVIEKYEPKPSQANPSNAKSIKECYPYDPARILSRTTYIYYSWEYYKEQIIDSGITEYMQSCNLNIEDAPATSFSGGNGLVETISESWVYNTQEETIAPSPSYIPQRETIKYTKTHRKNVVLENSMECNLTYGQTFEFLSDRIDAIDFMKTFYSKKCIGRILDSANMEIESIYWLKEIGSQTWTGTRSVQTSNYRTTFNTRRAKMAEYAKKTERGEINTGNFDLFKTNFSLFLSSLEGNLGGMSNTFSETRDDWSPQFQTAPAEEKIYNVPWERELTSGASASGESLSLNTGRFGDENILQVVVKEIKNARAQRLESLSITNINEIFKVGEIDSPSFSVDSDGVRTSGVYLNG